jgi:Tol biopolymer transport system component
MKYGKWQPDFNIYGFKKGGTMLLLKILQASFLILFVSALANAKPMRFAPEALQQNSKITLTPSFTPDGKTIYFAQSECTPIWECPQRLKKSVFGDNGWSSPQFVQLPTNDRVDWPMVTPDGITLVFSWSAPREDYKNLDITENFDLYTLDLRDPQAIPKPIMGADINCRRAGAIKSRRYVYNEAYPSITSNGDLYFMTERPDGIGERDIYFAPANSDGS